LKRQEDGGGSGKSVKVWLVTLHKYVQIRVVIHILTFTPTLPTAYVTYSNIQSEKIGRMITNDLLTNAGGCADCSGRMYNHRSGDGR
jgi:hypothetical protein